MRAIKSTFILAILCFTTTKSPDSSPLNDADLINYSNGLTVVSSEVTQSVGVPEATSAVCSYTPSSNALMDNQERWIENLIYDVPPNKTSKKTNFEGTMLVRFTVDEKGKLTDFHTSPGPEAVVMEAIKIIENSGKWTPAFTNGKPTASLREVVITFREIPN